MALERLDLAAFEDQPEVTGWPNLLAVPRAEFHALVAELRGSRKVVAAIKALTPHFIEQPPMGDHKDHDPYPTGPAYMGPQEPFDALIEALEDLEFGDLSRE